MGEDLIKRMRDLEFNQFPEQSTVVKLADIAALCRIIDGLIPSLDLLQAHLEKGYYLAKQDGNWWLFSVDGEGIVSGKDLRGLLINLIFLEC